jgi:hypothetical protein
MAKDKVTAKPAASAGGVKNIVKVSQGETAVKAPAAAKGGAVKLRVLAVCSWVLAIAAEVVAILILNKYIYTGDSLLLSPIAALVVDLIFVIAGSQLWKKANRLEPASAKDKLKFWLWNNLGVIVSVIAFLPVILLLLSDKKMDKKSKKLVTLAAAAALLIAGAASYDWDPVSMEDAFPENAQEASIGSEVYWTRFGKKYHTNQDCPSLSRSETLFQGAVADAYEAKRLELCAFCAGRE